MLAKVAATSHSFSEYESRVFGLLAAIEWQGQEIATRDAEIARKNAEIDALRAELKELQERLSANSRNSSKPPRQALAAFGDWTLSRRNKRRTPPPSTPGAGSPDQPDAHVITMIARIPGPWPAIAGLDFGHPAVKEAYMTSETNPGAESGQASVVIASFDSYRHAEHMLASLGRGFRTKARKGGTTAVVVRGNPDGSLKISASRVLSASDFMSTLIRVSLSWTIGFIGLLSMLKGAKSAVHAVRVRKGHTGSDEHRAHELLAEAGPHGALVLVRCKDHQTRHTVAAAAADSAEGSWDGSLTEFLAALEPSSAHDWVRAAVGEPSSTNR